MHRGELNKLHLVRVQVGDQTDEVQAWAESRRVARLMARAMAGALGGEGALARYRPRPTHRMPAVSAPFPSFARPFWLTFPYVTPVLVKKY